ncbi:LysR family transcriptional regulator [Comamonas testosteroni]|uniref:LysR family transcriptional regulator n=1 Tax=Comamonas testosteroni TaxID=285 RepID=A0A5A7MIB9_COMTE|nr:LysR family transcriptional regulator [Comamonas testosteroni]GEQ77476.1 LysR family transcriptional regulator [Comamonas testosteroni]
MDLSIRQLKVFITISQLGSFSEAAKALHVTGPALSLIVKSLEENTGFRVFDRTTRSVRLTPAGRVFLPQAERLMTEYRHLIRATEEIRQKRAGVVRVAASQLLSCTVIPSACARFQAQCRDIEVVHVDAAFDRIQEMLLRGDADLGIGPERICDPDIISSDLFSSPLGIVCSVNHPFAEREAVPWAELKNENVILADRSAAPLLARDAGYQVKFERIYDVGHYTTAMALANENKGVVVSARYSRNLLRSFNLVLVPLTAPQTLRKIMLYRNRRFTLSPAAERFAEQIGSLLSELD